MTTQRMVRKQFYIPRDLDEKLKRKAANDGRSEADLVREGLRRVVDEPPDGLTEREAWAEIEASMEQRLAMKVPQQKSKWNREELYEERLSKLPGEHKHPAVSR